MKKILNTLRFQLRYIFDKDFRYQIKYEEWSSKHSCIDCGNQDWQGHRLIMCDYGLVCESCLQTLEEQDKEIQSEGMV